MFKIINKFISKFFPKHLEKKIQKKFQQALSLHQAEQLAEAQALYLKILKIKPKHANSLHFLGVISHQTGDSQLAVDLISEAIAINPNSAAFYSNLGVALMDLKHLEPALASYDKAIALNPNNADFHYNRGNVLVELKFLDEAIKSYNCAIAINPDTDLVLDYLLHTKMQICMWNDFDSLLRKIIGEIKNNKKASTPFTMLSLIDDPEAHRKTTEIYVEEKFPPNNNLPKINKYPKHNKICIGYFSTDFKNHPVASLTAELYELHDRKKFEIHAFSLSSDTNDEMNLCIKSGVDHFHNIHTMSDEDIVTLARNLKIDIAVDLGGHTQYARTGIFAMRAAPIQTSYIGYLGTMGASYFDYLIADKTIIPAESQKYYSEKIVYLPSYQVNDSKKFIPTDAVTRQEFGLPENGFVFCCFNNNYKITPHVFDSWARIIKKVENSVLFIYAENELVKNNLKKEIILRGLDANRLVFGKFLSLDKYLARYRAADLFLDTLPYNAGTTASDALRMGLPVLTLMGESFASRIAASLLNSLDLPELITTTKEEYENLAIELATNPEKLKTIKEKLQKNILTTPLFNTKIFTNHIEAAYEAMYDRYQNDLLPDHIEVL